MINRTLYAVSLFSIALGVIFATVIEYYFTTSLLINSLIAVIFLLLGIILYQQKSPEKTDAKKEE